MTIYQKNVKMHEQQHMGTRLCSKLKYFCNSYYHANNPVYLKKNIFSLPGYRSVWDVIYRCFRIK